MFSGEEEDEQYYDRELHDLTEDSSVSSSNWIEVSRTVGPPIDYISDFASASPMFEPPVVPAAPRKSVGRAGKQPRESNKHTMTLQCYRLRKQYLIKGQEKVPLFQELFVCAQRAYQKFRKQRGHERQQVPNRITRRDFKPFLKTIDRREYTEFINSFPEEQILNRFNILLKPECEARSSAHIQIFKWLMTDYVYTMDSDSSLS